MTIDHEAYRKASQAYDLAKIIGERVSYDNKKLLEIMCELEKRIEKLEGFSEAFVIKKQQIIKDIRKIWKSSGKVIGEM